MTDSWEARGGAIVKRLMADFDLTIEQAAGVVGNLGFESAGFTKLHEIGQPEGLGGYGWGQWTADRRNTFLAYCKAKGFGWQTDDANYGYLVKELDGAYNYCLEALDDFPHDVGRCVFTFGRLYEAPGGTTATYLPGYDGRLDYAQRAMKGAAS